ncbi:MAG: helix-turn-helix transcriptional regulator [Eubacteriales bacterium]|nr:helix-turn-helix transcriptional regulator [Eubacteriales bacterium]
MSVTEKNEFWVEVGERLRDLRIDKGVSQEEVGKVAGVGRSLVNMWESGERQIKISALYDLAEYYHTTTDYILCRSDCRVIEATLESAARYTGLSDKAVNNLRNVNYPSFISYLENPKLIKICDKIDSIKDLAEEVEVKTERAQKLLDRVSSEYSRDYNEQLLKEAADTLQSPYDFCRLAIYELSELNSEVVNEMFDTRRTIEKARDVLQLLRETSEAVKTNY